MTTATTAINVSRIFDDSVSTSDMVNVITTLLALGFKVSDDGNTLRYASGSICNNRKFIIRSVRMSTAPDDKDYLTVLFYYEEEEYPSYDIIDHKLTFEGGMTWEGFLKKYFKYQLERLNRE